MNSNASSSKRKPNKKKHMTTKSPCKSGDIGALLCKPTTSTKLINDIENDVPTRISNLLVKISQTHKKVKETCYMCQYSLYNNCSILQRKSRRNRECLVRWLDETPQLPDIDFINNFHYELLLQYANSTSDTGFSSGNENNNSIQKDGKEKEIANNLQVNKIINENNLTEIDKIIPLTNENNADDNENIGDIQDKQCFDVEQEYDNDPETKIALEYFGLSQIEDMFTRSDNEEAGCFDVEQEYDNDPETKIALEYFGLSRIEDMFTRSDNEEAGYQSDSTIINSPDLTKKVKSCDGKILRKRHISESDSEGPVYKSKKSGHQQIEISIASSATSSTSASTHAANRKKARDVETREERDNECDNKGTVYESDNIMGLSPNNSVKNMISFVTNENDNNSKNNNDKDIQVIETNVPCNVISDTDIDSEGNIDTNSNDNLLRERNNNSNIECQEIESVNKGMDTNIASLTTNETINLPFDDNDNDIQVIETNVPCNVISDTDSDSEDNIDTNSNGNLLRERNNDSNNECQEIESVNKGMNTNIASFTTNETITLPFDDNDNDIQVIETNVPRIVISDTDSDSEDNIDTNTNGKLLRKRNNEARPEADDGSASYKVIATYAITDSDSDPDDGRLDKYLRY